MPAFAGMVGLQAVEQVRTPCPRCRALQHSRLPRSERAIRPALQHRSARCNPRMMAQATDADVSGDAETEVEEVEALCGRSHRMLQLSMLLHSATTHCCCQLLISAPSLIMIRRSCNPHSQEREHGKLPFRRKFCKRLRMTKPMRGRNKKLSGKSKAWRMIS